MKSTLLLLLFFLAFSFSSNAQYSAKYSDLIKRIETSTDSVKLEGYFKNGKTKASGYQIQYQYDGKDYAFITGKYYSYFKNGNRNETDFDSFGNFLLTRNFDSKGNILYESKTLCISTSATSIKEFLDHSDHLSYIRMCKYYRHSKELNNYYLFKEGKIANGKKTGTWSYYYPNGKLKKEKKYDEQQNICDHTS